MQVKKCLLCRTGFYIAAGITITVFSSFAIAKQVYKTVKPKSKVSEI